MTPQPVIEAMPAHLMTRGADPKTAADELISEIKYAIVRHPRSLQKAIGPSEVGHECQRALGYKALGYDENPREAAWKPTIGTAGHAWCESVFDRYNMAHYVDCGYRERYYIETRVHVGNHLDGSPINGSSDIYDRVTCTNWDWKFVGKTMLQTYRRKGPHQQYRIQAHLYGQGWWNAGVPCDYVGIIFLPRDGELRDAYIWSEPFDPQIAADGLSRLHGVEMLTGSLGTQALPLLTTADVYCNNCPFFKQSGNIIDGCPGHNLATGETSKPSNQLAGLI